MKTFIRPATARATATEADIIRHAEASARYVAARRAAQAARVAETAAYAEYAATVAAVYYNG